jgi:hypothetical protein
MDTVEDNDNKTPQKSFEDLWGDEKEAPPLSQIATLKKSNKARNTTAFGSTPTKSNTSQDINDSKSESGTSGKHSKSSKRGPGIAARSCWHEQVWKTLKVSKNLMKTMRACWGKWSIWKKIFIKTTCRWYPI